MVAAPAKEEDFYVVGIGASAGGLGALRTLFASMPAKPGYACVIVVHLSPEHESHLVELLQPYTKMPVQQVRRTVQLRPDHVYVIPPNANLNTIDTHLRLSELEPRRVERATIDHFLRTLAATHDGRSVGVILTGSGSDGALGMRLIKEGGGLTIAQDPAEAEYESMPRSAILTGTVDLILPVRQVPDEIARYCATRPQLPSRDGDRAAATTEEPRLDDVLEELQRQSGQDFSMYRRAPLLQRIGHRMQLRHLDAWTSYVELLRSEPGEVYALHRDLLLHVTEFFQDAALYHELEHRVLPDLFSKRRKRVRGWSIGCSTGEEAYSLAMLLIEQAERLQTATEVQVFASDLSDDALQRARLGLYPHEVATTVGAARLERFFVPEGSQFRIRKDVRERVIFAAHDIFKDPPYSHLDLIICRNLLCELQPQVRLALLNVFFYALQEGGALVIGARDEMDAAELFFADAASTQIFYRRAGGRRAVAAPWVMMRPEPPADIAGVLVGSYTRSTDELYRSAIERYMPPTVLIDSAGEVLRFSTCAHRYIRMPGGEFTNTLAHMVPPSIRVRLEDGFQEVRKTGRAWASDPFVAEMGRTQRQLVLRIDPLEFRGADERLLVIFDEGQPSTLPRELSGAALRNGAGLEAAASSTGIDPALHSPGNALHALREQLAASREELRTVNEALAALDAENRARLSALAQASDDLRNILESTCVATIVFDERLRIMRFTASAAGLLQLTTRDVGRHLKYLGNTLMYEGIEQDAERVMRHASRVDREVAAADGRWYLSRMLPYRAAGRGVEGVVLSYIDISDRRWAEAALRESEQRQRLTVELVPALLWWADPLTQEVSVNYQWRSYTGQSDAEVQDFGWLDAIHPGDLEATREAFAHAFATGEPLERQQRIRRRADGEYRWHLVRHVPVHDDNGTISRWFGAAIDVDESHQLQERQQILVGELQHRTRNLITLVRALSDRTLGNAGSLENFQDRFNRRLGALARVQGLLSHLAAGERVTFDQLLSSELAAMGAPADKMTLQGAAGVPLRSSMVQIFALALHELATNAVKYGALSPAGGHLDVRWHVEPAREGSVPTLRVEWRESGVSMPDARAQEHRGYGRELIESGLPYQLKAQTSYTPGPDGVRCTIALPIPFTPSPQPGAR